MPSPLAVKLRAGVGVVTDEDTRIIDALCARPERIAKHQQLAQEGEKPDRLQIMIEGWAARHHGLPDGCRQISAFMLPGDICDVGHAVLSRADHGVIALTPVKVASITRTQLEQAVRDHPTLKRALRWAKAVEEAILRTWLIDVGRRNAYARIAHRLCELEARLKLIDTVNEDGFALPVTQEQLADALGLTSVHVNRTLQSLCADGLLSLHAHRVTILDRNRLIQAAGFDAGYLHIPTRGSRAGGAPAE